MKIGLSACVMDRGRSGVARYTVQLVRALLAEAPYHEFVLLALERDLPEFEFARSSARLIPVAEAFREPARNFFWHQFRLPALARSLELDVLHIPTWRRFLWSRPCGLVGTVHDLPSGWPKPVESWNRALYRRGLLEYVARRQDELVAGSRAVAERLERELRLSASRVTVIPNGVDHEWFHPGARDAAATAIARNFRIHPPFFLCVARLDHPAKNHLRLISAFNQFKANTPSPWQLVLVGADGNGGHLVRQAARRSPYAPDIHSLGFVAAEDLPSWYRLAGACVFPAFDDGCGLAPLEALACGCPVLATAGSAAAEICGDGAVVAESRDTGHLRDRLTELAFDPALRARLGFAGILQASKRDWRRTAAATLEVYHRAARRQREPVLAEPALPAP